MRQLKVWKFLPRETIERSEGAAFFAFEHLDSGPRQYGKWGHSPLLVMVIHLLGGLAGRKTLWEVRKDLLLARKVCEGKPCSSLSFLVRQLRPGVSQSIQMKFSGLGWKNERAETLIKQHSRKPQLLARLHRLRELEHQQDIALQTTQEITLCALQKTLRKLRMPVILCLEPVESLDPVELSCEIPVEVLLRFWTG